MKKKKKMKATPKQFANMVEVLRQYLEGELTEEELNRLGVITNPAYKQYTIRDLELLKKVFPKDFEHIKINKETRAD